MGEFTGISWTDHTLNWWWGCTEVTAACDNCYARVWANRMRGLAWGRGAERVLIRSAPKDLRKWDRKAGRDGVVRKVFAHSMSDIFDPEVPNEWRREEFKAMAFTENLIFQFLTKRPEQVKHSDAPYPVDKVWLGTSLGSNADLQLAYEIVKHPAKLHWISYEPAIGQLDVNELPEQIKWIVVGGESGAGARNFEIRWAQRVIRDCKKRGIAVFVKQYGKKPVIHSRDFFVSDSHGKIMDEWLPETRIQEFPA